ncbi:MAG: BACON domain-containing protein [Bacteroidales bacterium]|nr:BACON domain-containing protein [Bacteroidales bacterium]
MGYRIYLAIALFIMLIAGCGKSEPERPAQGQQTQQPADPTMPQLTLENAAALFAYYGEATAFPYKVTGSAASSVTVKAANIYNTEIVSNTYNPSNGTGTVTVKLVDPEQTDTPKFCLETVLNGKSVKNSYTVNPYYLTVETKSEIVFSGEKDNQYNISDILTVKTNIPDFTPVFNTDASWLTVSENIIKTTEENRTGEDRKAVINVNDNKNHFGNLTVNAIQTTLGPEPKAGCVEFAEWPFKKACLEVADTDGDGEVSLDEAKAVKELNISNKGIKNLKGLEAFENVWKIDAQNNDIEDATVLKELHHLYWLDLQGNKQLKTFDLTGCTIYFEHCKYEITDELKYYVLEKQVGVSGGGDYCTNSDPWCNYSKHIRDERQTTDWSHQYNLIKVKEHTKTWTKNGVKQKYALCLYGRGFIDTDINDGSYERMMKDFISSIKENTEDLYGKWEYFDIYYMEFIETNRYYLMYYYDEPEWQNAINTDKNIRYETDTIIAEKIYPILTWQENEILLTVDVELIPNPRQAGYPGGIGANSRKSNKGHTYYNMFSTCFTVMPYQRKNAGEKDSAICYTPLNWFNSTTPEVLKQTTRDRLLQTIF